VTGIVTNEWYETTPQGALKHLYCTDQTDPDAHGDPAAKPIPGPANLRVPTFGDRLVEASPASRVVAISGKDRGAIFLAGHRPQHAVFWYDLKKGVFTTSKAYDTTAGAGKRVSELVAAFTDSPAGETWSRFTSRWKRLPVPEGVDVSALPQPARGIELFQFPKVGLGWDHVYDKDPDGYFGGIYHSPAIDELVADLAVAVVHDPTLALGRGKTTDLLCLSFSGQDLVAHYYGNESEENLDLLRRLDLQIGRVLDALESEVGKGNVLLALSADHGFSPIPEVRQKRGEAGGRLVYGKETVIPYLTRINRRLDEILCLDPKAWPVKKAESFSLYYAPKTFRTVEGPCGPAGREIGPAEIDAQLPRAVHELFAEEVEDVLLVSRRERWPANGAASFARNDLDPQRSGNAFVIPKPGVVVIWDAQRGSSHGSHLEESIHVPLVFWGAGVKPGAVDVPAAPYDLAPTLGARVGVTLPDAVGKALPLE
jgi:hypothetical protein